MTRNNSSNDGDDASSASISNPGDEKNNNITILGFGSLLSLKSARLTFPTLENFRLGRVPNHRRVFGHPASIFFQRNIANIETLEMSSLSCEIAEGQSFVCSVFEVPNAGLSAATATAAAADDDAKTDGRGWIPSRAFLEREEEFEIAMVPYENLTPLDADNNDTAPMRTETSLSDDTTTSTASSSSSGSSAEKKSQMKKEGVICRRSSDEAYISQWGRARWETQYLKYGVETIWNWKRDSGLRPCPVYLRHCVLASWNCGGGAKGDAVGWSADDDNGGLCYNSFLDDTYLVDRKTTIRAYLKQYPDVMTMEPPEGLRERYGG